MRYLFAVDEVSHRCDLADVLVRVDKYQLYLHPLGDDAFDEDRGGVADFDVARVWAELCESGKVRGELYEYPVGLYTAHSARNRLPGGKQCCIFFPRSKELLLRQKEPSRFAVNALDGSIDEIAAAESVSRVRDSRYRKRIDGQERRDTAAYVGKCAEGLKVGYLDADYIAGEKGGEIFAHAVALNASARQIGNGHAAFLFDSDYAEAYGFADAGDDGYVLLRLAGAAVYAFLAREYSRDASEIEMKIHLRVAEKGCLLEDRAAHHCALEPRQRRGIVSVFGCMYKSSFGFVLGIHLCDLLGFCLIICFKVCLYSVKKCDAPPRMDEQNGQKTKKIEENGVLN